MIDLKLRLMLAGVLGVSNVGLPIPSTHVLNFLANKINKGPVDLITVTECVSPCHTQDALNFIQGEVASFYNGVLDEDDTNMEYLMLVWPEHTLAAVNALAA